MTQATPERRLEITQLLERWDLVRAQLAQVEARLAVLVAQCPEATALLTVPEISAASAATIVAELGTPGDFQHPRQVLKLAGMNLTGGQTEGRRWQAKRGRPLLRRQLFLLAGRWCHSSRACAKPLLPTPYSPLPGYRLSAIGLVQGEIEVRQAAIGYWLSRAKTNS